MPNRVLVLQSRPDAAQALADHFTKQGDQVWQASSISQALDLVKIGQPNLVFVDLHLPGNEWLEFLGCLHHDYPKAHVIVTNKHPNLRRELQAKEAGVEYFLRAPFTSAWINTTVNKALGKTLASAQPTAERHLPPVRIPMRVKIALPYALISLLFALGVVYLVGRYIAESMQERYTNQLTDAALLSADWMVQEEGRILRTVRHLSNTEGFAAAIAAGDTLQLELLALPVAANNGEEAVEVLDHSGHSLLSLRRSPGEAADAFSAAHGEDTFAGYRFVQDVLNGAVDERGDKYAGLVRMPAQADTAQTAYNFYVAGPVFDAENRLVGAVVVGRSLETLAQENRESTLAQITLYNLDGSLMASTFFIREPVQSLSFDTVGQVLEKQDEGSVLTDWGISKDQAGEAEVRSLAVASSQYSELLAPWEARGGEDLGVIGVALAQNFQFLPSLMTRLQVWIFVALAFVSVVTVGIALANRVTRPLARVVQASAEVADGNLEVKVPSGGDDEMAVVAYAFNYMVSGLQEGLIYRDLLGRTVSPEVRDTLRRSFESGELRLEGQNTTATVMMTDIRGFTSMSEKEEPTTILNWLNEYFGELVPAVNAYEAVVDKFEGDAMLAYFGILPRPLPPEESACQACQAALQMLKVLDELNTRRLKRGEPAVVTGISIHTGALTAGGLGTSDHLNYTIIGDTVNTTQRLQAATRSFGENGIVISENVLAALRGNKSLFRIEPLGQHSFPGKQELLWVYRLLPGAPWREGSRG